MGRQRCGRRAAAGFVERCGWDGEGDHVTIAIAAIASCFSPDLFCKGNIFSTLTFLVLRGEKGRPALESGGGKEERRREGRPREVVWWSTGRALNPWNRDSNSLHARSELVWEMKKPLQLHCTALVRAIKSTSKQESPSWEVKTTYSNEEESGSFSFGRYIPPSEINRLKLVPVLNSQSVYF